MSAFWPEGVRVVGLTGGIASGKSTVSAMFKELGAKIVDADEIAREAVAPGSAGLRQVSARFLGVVGPDGRLQRDTLAARIFGNGEERQALNAILHPIIQQEMVRQVEALAAEGETLVIYDAPLIVENQLHQLLDGVILVAIPKELQIQRLIARNAYSLDEAQARVASQLPLEEKKKVATAIIDNSGSLESTRAQVERLWQELRWG